MLQNKSGNLKLWANLHRQDMDSGVFYKIEEAYGTQKVCNPCGYLIKPFDPRITGKYNYDDRILRIKQSGADLGEVGLPLTLKSNYKRNYLPQMNNLEGYVHMPRPIVPPYTNI